MEPWDALIMDTDKLKTQINELSRALEDIYSHIDNLAGLFKEYHSANDRRYLGIEKRISRLEGKTAKMQV